MTAYVAECGITNANQLSQRLRPSLLALKQFEQCYIVARWIRNLFMDITNRLNRTVARGRRPRLDHTSVYKQLLPSGPQQATESQFQTQLVDEDERRIQSTENAYSTGDPGSAGEASSYVYESSPFELSLQSPTAAAAADFGSFLPNFTTHELLPQQFSTDGTSIEFPSPTSFEYQHLHFLADLGLSSLGDPHVAETSQGNN